MQLMPNKWKLNLLLMFMVTNLMIVSMNFTKNNSMVVKLKLISTNW